MIVIIALMALSIVLDVLFVASMWPPWRSENPSVAWLLVSLAGFTAMYELFVLMATLDIEPWGVPVLLVLLGKDAVLIWRLVKVRRANTPPLEKRAERTTNNIEE